MEALLPGRLWRRVEREQGPASSEPGVLSRASNVVSFVVVVTLGWLVTHYFGIVVNLDHDGPWITLATQFDEAAFDRFIHHVCTLGMVTGAAALAFTLLRELATPSKRTIGFLLTFAVAGVLFA